MELVMWGAVWGLIYLGGLLVWPAQMAVRRRWDIRSKALGVVCAIHVVLLALLVFGTEAFSGTDAHHAWWVFVLLNGASCFGSVMTWLVTSEVKEPR